MRRSITQSRKRKQKILLINIKSSPYLKLWLALTLTILCLSTLIIIINSLTFQYIGNNYFPNNTLLFGIFCFLFLTGAHFLKPSENNFTQFALELLMFFLTMTAITYATNAVQLTPFPLIDTYLISYESSLGISLTSIMAWGNQYPLLTDILTITYASLPMQMAFIPLLIMLTIFFQSKNPITYLRRYYCLMLVTTIIGFTIYYFFPTAAPAAFLKSPYFNMEEYATGLKLWQIRHHIQPSTLNGGLIAFPSHHTIWAILCLYLVYPYKWAFFILLLNNALLIISCVLLGWHYPVDIIAALLIVWIAFKIIPGTSPNNLKAEP